MSEANSKVCPKCGGEMMEGGVTVPVEKMNVPPMDPLTPGFMHQSLPTGIDTFTTAPMSLALATSLALTSVMPSR